MALGDRLSTLHSNPALDDRWRKAGEAERVW